MGVSMRLRERSNRTLGSFERWLHPELRMSQKQDAEGEFSFKGIMGKG